MGRSGPQPCPAAPAHATCQPGHKQLSVLCSDPAWLSQQARWAERPVCSPAVGDGAGERRPAMSAYNCVRCGVPGR
eukprot:6897250-Prymnesium_polylepis.1